MNDYRYDVVKNKLRSKPISDIDHVLDMCSDKIVDSVAASVKLLLFRVDRSSSCSVPRSLFQEFPDVPTTSASDQTQQRAMLDAEEEDEVEEAESEEEAKQEVRHRSHRSRPNASNKRKSTKTKVSSKKKSAKSCGKKRKRKRSQDSDDDSKRTVKKTR